ncbi:MAG: acetate/propionate family kinase [Nitrospiraceae bacterium]|nr:acetate/propionate family kinase [Nitrospiraceae bacterium]
MNVLAINSGSSSVKCKLVEVSDVPGDATQRARVHYEGVIEDIGPAAKLSFGGAGQEAATSTEPLTCHVEAVQRMLRMLEDAGRQQGESLRIDAVGHRVVHGGEEFRGPVLINDAVTAAIERLSELAPLHNPGCLAGIRGAGAVMGPGIPMVAVFDTAFHRSIPPRAATYAIDLDLARKHRIQRFGFHGIAHASLATIAAAALNRPLGELRLITVQLGNGCSATAIDRGLSVDTSMGFTPLEGLVMGTRSGDLDPALITYLVRKEGLTTDALDGLLNERSGLLGISDVSQDMREILEAAQGKPDSRAALAVAVFCYRVRKYIGAYLAVLGGADALVFGGGIGERSAIVRATICDGMDWCGLQVDPRQNAAVGMVKPGDARQISAEHAPMSCYVAGVDEGLEIARATRDCVMAI